MSNSQLAIHGGPKVRTEWNSRHHFGQEEKDAVNAIFDKSIETGDASGYNGEEEEKYCEAFATYMGGGYADAVNSGTTAVFVALKALDLEPFSEVIVGAITDPGGMMPIVMANCIPMVADTTPGKFNAGSEQIEALITPRTKAIIIAHISGESSDIDKIMELAKKHNLYVIEDCAQAHGGKYQGKMLGSFGDVAAFSTMFGKHHCTGGQGGVVFTKSKDMYERVRRASDRGKPFGLQGATNCVASLNFNLSDIAGAIGQEQLKKLPSIVEKRRKIIEQLTSKFSELQSVIIPEQLPGVESAYWWWGLKLDESKLTCSKEEFCESIKAEGFHVMTSYQSMPHLMDWYKNKKAFGSKGFPWTSPQYEGDANQEFPCPNALKTIKEHFVILMNENWSTEEVNDIFNIIKKVEMAYLK